MRKKSGSVRAFYFHCTDGRVDLVLTTHVDDFLWACADSGQAVIQKLRDRFEVGRLDSKSEPYIFVVTIRKGWPRCVDRCCRQYYYSRYPDRYRQEPEGRGENNP